ncbi:MAG: hypothetical protein ABW252_05315 [Polyangiales bacterium]
MRRPLLRLVVALSLLALTASACASTTYVPSTTPLAKLVDKGAQAELFVGHDHAPASPFSRRYISLLHETARPAAEKSQRHLRGAFFTHLVAAAAGVAAIVLAVNDWHRASELDNPTGRATLGLTIGSALVGGFATTLSLRARGELDEAVATHNDAVFQERAEVPLEPAAAPAPAPTVAPESATP